jgi:putative nucleotidyltransferase with HDIG domain
MTKRSYKVLIFDGTRFNVPKIRAILSDTYQVLTPKSETEAAKLLGSVAIDLVLLSPESFKAVSEKLDFNKKHLNPNLLKILISEPSERRDVTYLEKAGEIFHFVETPVSGKELSLILKMAFKSYEVLAERNRLVEKLSLALVKLSEANMAAVRVLSEAIEAKDPYTRGHCSRVSKLSKAIAEHLGYDNQMMSRLELGAFLHDIGKIGVRGAILNKNDKLTDDEMEHVKAHTLIGVNIVKGVEWCKKFIPIIRNHHEKINGMGYPDGLKGNDIPLDARILSIADAYDAMTSERPYRHALPLDEALRRIKADSGTQFDPELVKIFIEKEIYKKDLSSVTGLSFKTEEEKRTLN